MHTTARQTVEPRLVSEYCLARWPTAIIMLDVPLGANTNDIVDETGVHTGTSTFRPFRPRADGTVITPSELWLIEGKILRVLDGLTKLPFYADLITSTPELQPYWALPIKMLLITPSLPGWCASLATRHDITVEYYHPQWVHEYATKIQNQWTGQARQGRAKRRAVLESLGYTDIV
jgi:hypothetical protein